MIMSNVLKIVTSLIISVIFSGAALSHDSLPTYIELNEIEDNIYHVKWKSPLVGPNSLKPIIVMPKDCVELKSVNILKNNLIQGKDLFQCDTNILGRSIVVTYPSINVLQTTLLRVVTLEGTELTTFLRAEESAWLIPKKTSTWGIFYEYIRLGVEHIWQGIDHLFFVLCLICIAQTPHRILIVITGFTLSHSVTLILSSLSIVSISIPSVEACIALSIAFLAHELVVADKSSWTWKYPLIVSLFFGLLHGFGFASGLINMGIPENNIVVSLLSFNLGVELGQVIFILIILLLMSMWQKVLIKKRLRHLINQKLVGSVVGVVASFWFIERFTLIVNI
jgi:hydrogenase/urease accessory protein HupE